MADVFETFFTTVGCMDGRVQEVVAEFGRKKFGTDYPDTITEAGIVGQLAEDTPNSSLVNLVRYKVVDVSLGKHHSAGVIVHGHAECAGNPVSDDQQRDDIRRSVKLMQTFVSSVPIIGVFVKRNPHNEKEWVCEEVSPTLVA